MKKPELPKQPRKVSRLPQCNKSNRLKRRYHNAPSRAQALASSHGISSLE